MSLYYARITAFTFLALLLSNAVIAQINNQPYSFGRSGRGVGISVGGREAIINEKIHGVHPDNMIRTPAGELLEVYKGPGGTAFAIYPGTGRFIPEYHGTSFREYSPDIAVGIFNPFFMPASYGSGYVAYPYSYSSSSGATVSTWTARVSSDGMPISYQEGNVVDSWTGQVLIMRAAP